MINYFKWVAFFFLLTVESLIKLIFSLFSLKPDLDLSSWVIIMVEAKKIRKAKIARKEKVLSSEEDYRNLSSEAYDGIQE